MYLWSCRHYILPRWSWSLRACLFFFPRLIWYHCVSLLTEVRNRNLFLFEGNSVEAIVLTLGCLFLNSWLGFYWRFWVCSSFAQCLLIVCSLFACTGSNITGDSCLYVKAFSRFHFVTQRHLFHLLSKARRYSIIGARTYALTQGSTFFQHLTP